jgi:hypothetical protein
MWPRIRPPMVSCGCIAAGKPMQSLRLQGRTTGVSQGSRLTTKMAAIGAGGDMAIGLWLGRGRDFLAFGLFATSI